MSFVPSGFNEWEPPRLLDRPWLDGVFFQSFLPQPTKIDPREESLFLIRTHAGTDIQASPFAGSASPLLKDPKKFTISYNPVDSSDDDDLIRSVRAKGSAVQFCCGWRCKDTFQATSGSVYLLSRPLASSAVPGIDETGYPTVVKLNGVVTPSAATVVGQTVTANATGLIEITYTPVHLVQPKGLAESLLQTGVLGLEFTLEEGILGDFG